MFKYHFKIVKRDIHIRKRLSSRRHTSFNTDIKIDNSTLKIITDRDTNGFDRKYNSNTEGYHEININAIKSIKFKPGYATSLNFNQIWHLLVLILGIIGFIFYIIHAWEVMIHDIGFAIFPFFFFIIGIPLLSTNFTFKCMQINYMDDNVISKQNIKKVVFPVSSIFFFPTPHAEKEAINNLIDEIKGINPGIKYKKDKLFKISMSLFILLILIFVTVPFILKHDYLLENSLSYNEENNLLYTDIIFDKGTLINIEKKDGSSRDYIYSFKLNSSGEEIQVINPYNVQIGETYNIYITNYYKKDDNTLFSSNYTVYSNGDVGHILVDGTLYFYDYINNVKYCFNNLGSEKIYSYEISAYYKNNNTNNTLYNFIYSSDTEISISNDFDIKSFISNGYTTLEKLDSFESEYGNCYILKANTNTNKTNYLLYIENKYKNTFNGIILNSRINDKGYFNTDTDAINSFKTIVNETN